MAATTFPLFPLLPTELRLKIWHHALPLFPRVLELKPVRWNDSTFPETLPPDFRTVPKWKLSISSIPTLLSVSSEARYELLSLYGFRFHTKGVASSPDCQNPWEVPFCPGNDMLYVNVKESQKVYDGAKALFSEIFGGRSVEVGAALLRLAGSDRFWACLREEGVDGGLGDLASLEEAVLVVSSRTMRLVEEMDECATGTLGLASWEEKVAASSNGSPPTKKFEMRMCVAADLTTQTGRRWVDCDFMCSMSDIYIFT